MLEKNKAVIKILEQFYVYFDSNISIYLKGINNFDILNVKGLHFVPYLFSEC
jgi:hypothetical protein